MVKNDIGVHVLIKFVGLDTKEKNDGKYEAVHGSRVRFAHVNAWTAAVMPSLT